MYFLFVCLFVVSADVIKKQAKARVTPEEKLEALKRAQGLLYVHAMHVWYKCVCMCHVHVYIIMLPVHTCVRLASLSREV